MPCEHVSVEHVSPIPETREELAERLDAIGVRADTYSLGGGHPSESFVVDLRPEGWVVYYSERGNETSPVTHQFEADACADLYARVTRDDSVFFDLVAGPAPIGDADATFDGWLSVRGLTRVDLPHDAWKFHDISWDLGPPLRRYFVRILTIRDLDQAR